MITTPHQHDITNDRIAEFETQLAKLRAVAPSPLNDLDIAAVDSLLSTLRREVAEYEQLTSGNVDSLPVTGMHGIADLLIQARIAKGWSQSDLARALHMAPQQVQRYEATEYRSASLARLVGISDVLGFDITGTAVLSKV
jgi:HTH-type transcriptional regulator / antitoxin HigA